MKVKEYKIFKVFPACAGVILDRDGENVRKRSFPRVCGGDPAEIDYMKSIGMFSPRVRG